jgi:hypothetical protein
MCPPLLSRCLQTLILLSTARVARRLCDRAPATRPCAARGAWGAQPALPQDYRKYRPNVERVISLIASRGGRRVKLRYLGTAKNNAWLRHRTAALNLRNLINRGLARRGGAWVLA